MREDILYKLEQKTGCFVVDGHCKGLYYFFSDEDKDKKRLGLAGVKGITILTFEQAKNVAEDIMDVINEYGVR